MEAGMKRKVIGLMAAVSLPAAIAYAVNPPAVQWRRKFSSYDTLIIVFGRLRTASLLLSAGSTYHLAI